MILSICAIKSEKIGLICNKGREKSIDRIVKETDLQASDLVSGGCAVDGSNTIEIYKAIMDFYAEWNEPDKIALGITGGTKVMSSAAAMAGAILGADIYYVHTEVKNILNKPVPCSEYLRLLDNPYIVFGDFEIEKAKSLYEVHDYAGAQRIFNELEREVGDVNQAIVYETYRYLCTTYEDWDNLDTGKAGSVLDNLLKILMDYPRSEDLRHLHDYQDCLEKQREALKHLQSFIKEPQLALKRPNGFHFAFTLYHNALRREAQGKLDMACLILYRLLEWIAQQRLAEYRINTKTPNYSELEDKTNDELLRLYNEKRKEVYPTNVDGSETQDLPELPSKIALVDGFLILGALEDEVVEDLDWGVFRNVVDTRNQSIFAHGMKKIEKKSYDAFKSIVEERFKKAQEIADINADAFNEQHKFIAPLP